MRRFLFTVLALVGFMSQAQQFNFSCEEDFVNNPVLAEAHLNDVTNVPWIQVPSIDINERIRLQNSCGDFIFTNEDLSWSYTLNGEQPSGEVFSSLEDLLETDPFTCDAVSSLFYAIETLDAYWDSLWAQSEGWTTSKVLREEDHGFDFWRATKGAVDIRIGYSSIIRETFASYAVPSGSDYLVVTGSDITITPPSDELNTPVEIRAWMADVYGAYTYVAPVIDLGTPTEWTEIDSDHNDYDLAWENCNGDKIFSDLIDWVYQLNGETTYSEVFSSMEALLEAIDVDCDPVN